jgi:hypothetical protein
MSYTLKKCTPYALMHVVVIVYRIIGEEFFHSACSIAGGTSETLLFAEQVDSIA